MFLRPNQFCGRKENYLSSVVTQKRERRKFNVSSENNENMSSLSFPPLGPGEKSQAVQYLIK